MQAQSTPSPAQYATRIDHLILDMLTIDHPGPWAESEIACELNSEIDAVDGLERLRAAGLVHRIGEFAFPTRAATRAGELASPYAP